MLVIGKKPSPDSVRRWKKSLDLAKIEMGMVRNAGIFLKTSVANCDNAAGKRRRASG